MIVSYSRQWTGLLTACHCPFFSILWEDTDSSMAEHEPREQRQVASSEGQARSRSDRGDGDRGGRDRDPGRDRDGGRRKRRKVCFFCVEPRERIIDYKNLEILNRFLDDRARIRKARQTGNCRRHQRKLAQAIKRARHVALLEFTRD